MDKILLLSVVLMNVWLPVRAAADPNPRRALKKALHTTALFNLFYLFAVLFIYPRIL